MSALTIREEQFLENHILHGMHLADAWKIYKPDSVQDRDLSRRSGWKLLRRLKERSGEWPEVFDVAGIGPVQVAHMLSDCLEATKTIVVGNKKIETPDHIARLRAASLLMDIHGLRAPKDIRVESKGEPLPIVYLYESDETTDSDTESEDAL